jgi:hypothetical protein
MALESPATTTLPIRKPGAPRGNTNALKHGMYASVKTHPARASQLSEIPSLHPAHLYHTYLRLLDEHDQLLGLLVPRMLTAKTFKDRLIWFRPVHKLIRGKGKLMKAILFQENPKRTLYVLARDSSWLVDQEFNERGIREYPVFLPLDFDNFCSDPSSTHYRFHDNTLLPDPKFGIIVPNIFLKSRRITLGTCAKRVAELASSQHRLLQRHESLELPSPFLTDHQWFRIEHSFNSYQKELTSSRKYKPSRHEFPARLLMEAVLIKLAYNLPWKELPRVFCAIHSEFPSFPRWKCQSFYRDLYNSGFLRAVYKQLRWHFDEYGEATLEKLVKKGCFQIKGKAVSLAPNQPLTWQNVTALLLLQRALRAKRRHAAIAHVSDTSR